MTMISSNVSDNSVLCLGEAMIVQLIRRRGTERTTTTRGRPAEDNAGVFYIYVFFLDHISRSFLYGHILTCCTLPRLHVFTFAFACSLFCMDIFKRVLYLTPTICFHICFSIYFERHNIDNMYSRLLFPSITVDVDSIFI